MRIIRGLNHLSSLKSPGSVVTIGNFDGVHLGHQSILKQLRAKATDNNLETVVILFEPQPQEFFLGQDAPARLTSLREKLTLLQQQAIDTVLCLRFDQFLAAMTAKQFVQTILVDGLTARHVIVGDDFRFGEGREGGFEELRKFGEQANFEVERTATCELEGQRVSSSWIRQILTEDDFQKAKTLLGRPYCISGRVRHGDKRGRELGYPTLNLDINRLKPVIKGVFVSTVIMDNARLPAVSNLGTRPVFDGGSILLESHIFDFNQDVYGKYLSVEFHHKIRGEIKFDSIEALKKQIDLDALNARTYFKNNNMNENQ